MRIIKYDILRVIWWDDDDKFHFTINFTSNWYYKFTSIEPLTLYLYHTNILSCKCVLKCLKYDILEIL